MSHWGIEAVTEVSRELTTSVSIKFRLVLPLDAWELLLPQAANVQADIPSNATVAIFLTFICVPLFIFQGKEKRPTGSNRSNRALLARYHLFSPLGLHAQIMRCRFKGRTPKPLISQFPLKGDFRTWSDRFFTPTRSSLPVSPKLLFLFKAMLFWFHVFYLNPKSDKVNSKWQKN